MAIIPARPLRGTYARLTSGKWAPPQSGPTVVAAGSVLPDHEHEDTDKPPRAFACTPARRLLDGTWEYVADVMSVDVASGVARIDRNCTVLVRQDTMERIPDEGILGERLPIRVEIDHEFVDGVRLFCGCGTEITAEMMVRKPGGAS